MELAVRAFPARIAELGFSAQLPSDWKAHELPKEDVDFSNPARCLALAIVTAPHAAIVYSFAARPAYEDGTLQDWAWFLLNQHEIKPRALGAGEVAGVPAVVGEAEQESELGPMVVYFAFLEDGGRLINLTLSTPEMFADTMRQPWFALLESFTLEKPMGSRFSADAAGAPASASAEEPASLETPATDDAERVCTFAEFALADSPATLDPEHPINANLRDRGIGLVPNVIRTDDAEKRATLAAGAIEAEFDVPYGWHVIDDGQRTLLLDPSGEVQINLSLLPLEGRDTDGVLNDLEAQMRQDYPHPEFLRLSRGGIHALGARNIADAGQPIEQYHLLYPSRRPTMVLRARVTSTPARVIGALNLAEILLGSCRYAPSPREAPPPSDEPWWWQQALEFERQDRLEDAERVIREGVPHLAFASMIAELYLLRMLRLKEAGDAEGALAAFRKSNDFIYFYASMATSGGEGAALSLARDRFRARLVAAYGSDPE